tara:strand:- start:45 stop:362 length:318 start_codon:yes stop_codon:yes gene_type:complete
MAFTARHNISVTTPVDLITAGDDAGRISSILLTNTHASNSVSADLKIYNATSLKTVHIIKNTAIPAGASLSLDVSNIEINTSDASQDTLTITASTTGGLDVIINN